MALTASQAVLDDRRAKREQDRASKLALRLQQSESDAAALAQKLENLRYVRQRSSPDPHLERPFVEMYLQGVNLAGLELRNADFTSAKLRKARFTSADLRGARFASAIMNGSFLTDALLQRSRMQGARLREAHLTRASLKDAILREADLRGAYLTGADLRGADLRGAQLGGAHLEDSCADEGTLWPAGFSYDRGLCIKLS